MCVGPTGKASRQSRPDSRGLHRRWLRHELPLPLHLLIKIIAARAHCAEPPTLPPRFAGAHTGQIQSVETAAPARALPSQYCFSNIKCKLEREFCKNKWPRYIAKVMIPSWRIISENDVIIQSVNFSVSELLRRPCVRVGQISGRCCRRFSGWGRIDKATGESAYFAAAKGPIMEAIRSISPTNHVELLDALREKIFLKMITLEHSIFASTTVHSQKTAQRLQ